MDNLLVSNFAASLFALLNPFGILPIFISYTAAENKTVQRWLAIFVSVTVLGLLLGFFFGGSALLSFFGISLPAFRIAGGILLLLIGINLTIGPTGQGTVNLTADDDGNDFNEAKMVYRKIVIPLAMPLLVGPGVIANIILYATEAQSRKSEALYFGCIGTIIFISFLLCAILLSGRWLRKMLGSIGLNILTRILGLLVASMGTQFMITGLSNVIVYSIIPEILKRR